MSTDQAKHLRRQQALARIAHAEALGMVRCQPYACIGVKKPRWFLHGSYYDFAELPRPT
jgi:hypothetical protein